MMKKLLKPSLVICLISANISFAQISTRYSKEIAIKNILCKADLTINGTADYHLSFVQFYPLPDSISVYNSKKDTINLITLSPQSINIFLSNTNTFTAIKNTLKKAYPNDSVFLSDTISDKLYTSFKAYIASLLNEKNANDWGMSEDKFAEMELYETKISELNRLISKKISSGKKLATIAEADYKKIKKDAKIDSISKLAAKKSYEKVKKDLSDSLAALWFTKKELKSEVLEIKKQHTQPIVALSGSAFSFLNKNADSDSVKNNIMSVGVHAQRADLWDMDIQITLGQNEDVIQSSDRNAFGSSILVPGIRRFSFLSNYRQLSLFPYSRSKLLKEIGGSLSINVSQVQWQLTSNDSLKINNGKPVKVIPFAMDLCINHHLLNVGRSRTNLLTNAKLSTDIGFASRVVAGDAGLSQQFMRQFLGTGNQIYIGLLVGCRIQIDRVAVFYNGVIFPNSWYGNISGLTGGQVVSRIGLRVDIFQYKKQ